MTTTPWAIVLAVLAPVFAGRAAEGVLAFSQASDRLVVSHAGQPVATYVFRDERILRPYLTRLHAPGGVPVTRNHPPQPGVDATDHDTMHPGVWLAFGDVSGHDLWRNKAVIKHERFTEPPEVRDGQLAFTAENALQTAEGRTFGTQLSRLTLAVQPAGYLVVWEAAFTASQQELVFGDQEEMGLGVRVATAITEKNGGVILASTGVKGAKATWGKSFEWCDYSGAVDGRQAGVTLMPDPANFRPSWFHNRDYGLMVANPFGRKALTQGEPSRVVVKPGERLCLRFGVLLHAAAPGGGADLARAYRRFVGTPRVLEKSAPAGRER